MKKSEKYFCMISERLGSLSPVSSRSPVRYAFSFVTMHCLVAWLEFPQNGGRIRMPLEQVKEKGRFVCFCMRSAIKVSLIKMPYQSIENCSYTYLKFLWTDSHSVPSSLSYVFWVAVVYWAWSFRCAQGWFRSNSWAIKIATSHYRSFVFSCAV